MQCIGINYFLKSNALARPEYQNFSAKKLAKLFLALMFGGKGLKITVCATIF
ncbi:hypothetical protein HBA_0898 [Sodalis endosymbiont of Henestaris halophilus]|nr:hypothetical protein HBA_0898 [Sodalis endosymbiont of Henestaris halophilus]